MLMADSPDDLLRQFSSDSWFGSIDVETRRAMVSHSRSKVLQPGEFVYRQGDRPDGIYGIVSGALKISTLRDDGKEAVLTVLEPGDWFGEVSCIDGKPRPHDTVAVVPSKLMHLRLHHVNKLMEGDRFLRAMAALQSMRLRGAFALLEDAMLKSTRARIARRLRRLARDDAAEESTQRRTIAITQDRLATVLGITRQTLALELKAMVSEGAISLGYGRIAIASLDKLRALEHDPRNTRD
jgi:CRP-like cAMP-binding protein